MTRIVGPSIFILVFLMLCFPSVSYGQSDSSEIIYDSVDIKPRFPGGDDEMYKYLVEHIDYPQKAVDNNTQGTARISLVVSKEGVITDIRVLQEVGDGCSDAVVRAVQLMPKWKPAMKNGIAVNAKTEFPFTFNIVDSPRKERKEAREKKRVK